MASDIHALWPACRNPECFFMVVKKKPAEPGGEDKSQEGRNYLVLFTGIVPGAGVVYPSGRLSGKASGIAGERGIPASSFMGDDSGRRLNRRRLGCRLLSHAAIADRAGYFFHTLCGLSALDERLYASFGVYGDIRKPHAAKKQGKQFGGVWRNQPVPVAIDTDCRGLQLYNMGGKRLAVIFYPHFFPGNGVGHAVFIAGSGACAHSPDRNAVSHSPRSQYFRFSVFYRIALRRPDGRTGRADGGWHDACLSVFNPDS